MQVPQEYYKKNVLNSYVDCNLLVRCYIIMEYI